MSVFLKGLACSLLLVASYNSQAVSLSGENLPPAKNIGSIFSAPTLSKKASSSEKIGSGLHVKGSMRGTFAKAIAQDLAAEIPNYDTEVFLQTVEQMRSALEAAFSQYNFEINDVGVAYSAALIMIWEIAHDTQLPLDGAANAVKHITLSFDAIGEEYTKLDQKEKEKYFDMVMTYPSVLKLFVEGYKQTSDKEGVAQFQSISQQLFQNMTSIPYQDVMITDEGVFQGNYAKADTVDTKNSTTTPPKSTSSDW